MVGRGQGGERIVIGSAVLTVAWRPMQLAHCIGNTRHADAGVGPRPAAKIHKPAERCRAGGREGGQPFGGAAAAAAGACPGALHPGTVCRHWPSTAGGCHGQHPCIHARPEAGGGGCWASVWAFTMASPCLRIDCCSHAPPPFPCLPNAPCRCLLQQTRMASRTWRSWMQPRHHSCSSISATPSRCWVRTGAAAWLPDGAAPMQQPCPAAQPALAMARHALQHPPPALCVAGCAVSWRDAVGLDVEARGRQPASALKLARRRFSEAEYQALLGGAARAGPRATQRRTLPRLAAPLHHAAASALRLGLQPKPPASACLIVSRRTRSPLM